MSLLPTMGGAYNNNDTLMLATSSSTPLHLLNQQQPPLQQQQQQQQRRRVKSLPSSQEDCIPRQQQPRFKDDQYSPKWVRYSGQLKEGYCDTCPEGRWLQLKNSAYWYHKQFYHGISSVTGRPFAEPLEQRVGPDGVLQGLCHQCICFVPICNGRKRRNSLLWYKHAHKVYIFYSLSKTKLTFHVYSVTLIPSLKSSHLPSKSYHPYIVASSSFIPIASSNMHVYHISCPLSAVSI